MRFGPGECIPTNLADRIFHSIPQGCSHSYFRNIDKSLGYLRLNRGVRSTSFRSGLLFSGLLLSPPLGGKRVRFIHPQSLRWNGFVFGC